MNLKKAKKLAAMVNELSKFGDIENSNELCSVEFTFWPKNYPGLKPRKLLVSNLDNFSGSLVGMEEFLRMHVQYLKDEISSMGD